jgi:hypothetical protein
MQALEYDTDDELAMLPEKAKDCTAITTEKSLFENHKFQFNQKDTSNLCFKFEPRPTLHVDFIMWG